MAPVRQGSFLGGELAPQMWGRTDSAAYAQGLRRLKNAFVTRQGSLCKRPGTEWRGPMGSHEQDAPYFGPARIIPFIYSEQTSYVLEFVDGWIYFWREGSRVEVAPGDSYRIAHGYLVAELPRLKFVQSGDVLTLTHPEHLPRTLTRRGETDWVLANVDLVSPEGTGRVEWLPKFDAPVPTPDVDSPASDWEWSVSWLYVAGEDWGSAMGPIIETQPVRVRRLARSSFFASAAVWSSATAYGAGAMVRPTALSESLYVSLQASNTGHPPSSSPTWWDLVPETDVPEMLPVSPDKPVTIRWGALNSGFDRDAAAPPGSFWYGYRVYRGRGGIFGLVGEHVFGAGPISGSVNDWTDFGQAPDYGQPPLPDGPPVFVRQGLLSGFFLGIERPAVVTFHQERRVYARSNESPETVWFSRVADYAAFTPRLPVQPDDAFSIRLASRRREEVRSMQSAQSLVIFTNDSVWSVEGGGADGAQDATTIARARVISEVGASWVDPVVVDDAVLYPRAGHDGIQRLLYSNERGGYSGGDVSYLAQHLFRGRPVAAWSYARAPHGLTWVALADGALLSLTYLPEADVAAWAQHDIGGAVESMCVVPEDGADTLYLVVRRTTSAGDRRFLERLRHGVADDSTAQYLDAHAVLGPRTGPYTIGASPRFSGQTMQAVEDGTPTVRFRADALGGFTIPTPAGVAVQHTVYGLPFETSVDLLDLPMGGVRQKRVVSVGFEVRETGAGLLLGEQDSTAVPWRNRKVGDDVNQTGPFTGIAKVDIRSAWNLGGRAVLRHREPLHLEVLGITREVEGGG